MQSRFALLVLLSVLLAFSGCATAPDHYRCSASRPVWHYNEGASARAKKMTEAKHWDRQCTLVGVVSSAASGAR
jgi:hypothetical protein